jgi:hypothetical protein
MSNRKRAHKRVTKGRSRRSNTKAPLRIKLQRATRVVVARARRGDFSGVVR